MYRYDRNREFLDYYYCYDSNKYRVWLTSHVVYLLGKTLENDKNMHISIILKIYIRSIKEEKYYIIFLPFGSKIKKMTQLYIQKEKLKIVNSFSIME